MKSALKLICLLALSAYAQANALINPVESAFHDLKKLVGTWKVQNSESSFRIKYELTANDTVLIETWISSGKKKSLTLYHLDKDRLIATHYCPQGNQPRLELINPVESKKIEFKFYDVTNLINMGDSHQHYLSFEISANKNALTRTESYLKDKKESFDKIQIERE